jgi:hypothetical protein
MWTRRQVAKNILRDAVVQYAGTKGGLASPTVTLALGAAARAQYGMAFSATAALIENVQLDADTVTANKLHNNAAGIVKE